MFKRHRKIALGAASLMAAASIAVPGIAGATASPKKVAKPDFAYFAGKTITLIDPSPPAPVTVGTGTVVGAFLKNYLHLGAFNIEYITANGIIAASNDVEAAAPNGLTIGFGSLPSDILDLVTGPDPFSYNFKKVDWLGSIANSPAVLVSCDHPELTSFSQVVKSKTALAALAPAGSVNILRPELLASMYNFPVTPLTGYGATGLQIAGCLRGDGPLSINAISGWLNAAGTAFTPGLIPLLSFGSLPKSSPAYPAFSKVPTLASYVAKHPLKTKAQKTAYATLEGLSGQSAPGLPYFTAPNTPAPILLALQAALQAAYKDPTVKAAVAGIPDPNHLFTAAQVKQWINLALKDYAPEMSKVFAKYAG